MTMTLELPNELSEELEQQAERIGVSPQEHATAILSIMTAVGDRRHPLSGYREQLATTMLEMVRAILDSEPRSEEDRARLLRLEALLGNWASRSDQPPVRPSAMGKYAHIPGSSDDFARLKQEEIDREDGGTR